MRAIFLAAALLVPSVVQAADPVTGLPSADASGFEQTYRGPVTVLDGRTMRYHPSGQTVRIAGIETCNLPQWAFERSGYPYPCGPLGKAYLKRLVRRSPVNCVATAIDRDGVPLAECHANGKNLAAHIALAGLAITDESERVPAGADVYDSEALALQNGFGLNDTTVLDPQDWRAKANEKSLARRPFRDRNMIADGLGRVYEPVEPENPAEDARY